MDTYVCMYTHIYLQKYSTIYGLKFYILENIYSDIYDILLFNFLLLTQLLLLRPFHFDKYRSNLFMLNVIQYHIILIYYNALLSAINRHLDYF